MTKKVPSRPQAGRMAMKRRGRTQRVYFAAGALREIGSGPKGSGRKISHQRALQVARARDARNHCGAGVSFPVEFQSALLLIRSYLMK